MFRKPKNTRQYHLYTRYSLSAQTRVFQDIQNIRVYTKNRDIFEYIPELIRIYSRIKSVIPELIRIFN